MNPDGRPEVGWVQVFWEVLQECVWQLAHHGGRFS